MKNKNKCTYLQCLKNKNINRSSRNNKNKKIMNIEEPKSKRYVEVYAVDNEGTTMIIKKFIEEKGMHETYMDIYDKLMNMGKNAKWDVKVINVKTYNGDGGL